MTPPTHATVTCPTCKGDGILRRWNKTAECPEHKPCPTCSGTGKSSTKESEVKSCASQPAPVPKRPELVLPVPFTATEASNAAQTSNPDGAANCHCVKCGNYFVGSRPTPCPYCGTENPATGNPPPAIGTPTPLTDAALVTTPEGYVMDLHRIGPVVRADFARTLEARMTRAEAALREIENYTNNISDYAAVTSRAYVAKALAAWKETL